MTNPYAAYLETNILSANPLELVCMMYAGAIEAVRDARRHLAEGRIQERSQAITHAVEIVAELNNSLDHSAGELAVRLALLYDYMQRRLLDANFKQTDDGLAEVLSLLETLSEAWSTVSSSGVAPADGAPVQAVIPSSEHEISSPWNSVSPAAQQMYPVGGWSF